MIFVNGSIPRIVADELRKASKDAKAKIEIFPQDAKDPVWLEAVGVNGWLGITRDAKIRTRLNDKPSWSIAPDASSSPTGTT